MTRYTERLGDDLKEHWDTYTGLATGTGLEVYDRLTDGDLFGDYFNAWGGDKLVHGGFSYGLAKASIRGFEGAGTALRAAAEKTGNETVADYLTQAADTMEQPTFQHKAVVSGAAIALFSVTKEYSDAYWDWLDIAANTTGWGVAMADEYRRQGEDA